LGHQIRKNETGGICGMYGAKYKDVTDFIMQNMKEGVYWKYLDVNGMIIFKSIWKKNRLGKRKLHNLLKKEKNGGLL
jgi:hypothetical protein